MDYIEAQIVSFPAQQSHFNEVATYFKDKLWYQMGNKLLELSSTAFFKQEQHLVRMHEKFVSKFAKKINQLIFVRFSIAAADQQPDADSALAFLESVSKVVDEPQAALLAKMERVRRMVLAGHADECKIPLEEGKRALEEFSGVMEDVVHSALYLAALEFHKVKGTASDFFRNSLLYLTYTPLESLPKEKQTALSSDVGLAALLGHDIYNFGELLQHPVVKALEGTEFEWLGSMLTTLNRGDVEGFKTIYSDFADKHPVLRVNGDFLNQKIRVMNLIELVFQRPTSSRELSFKDIAQSCDVKMDEVELLVMKAFSLKVIKGSIDEVRKVATITWVQPRVLDLAQVGSLRTRLKDWAQTVEQTTRFLEANATELLASDK